MLVLIYVQTVCRDYQQTTKVATSKEDKPDILYMTGNFHAYVGVC